VIQTSYFTQYVHGDHLLGFSIPKIGTEEVNHLGNFQRAEAMFSG
jgi:hypothetical protein